MEKSGLGDLPLFDMDFSSEKNILEMEDIEEKDYQYMTKMYSGTTREILEEIEELCDQYEYDGSELFHEYLDRTWLLDMTRHVYKEKQGKEKEEKQDSLLYEMIYILLCGEIYHRRCRHRRKKRMFTMK